MEATKSLGLLSQIKSNFSCSGTIKLDGPLKVFFERDNGEVGTLQMPNALQKQIHNIAQQAKVSGFGKGHENVVDQDYRRACEILPNSLGFSPIYSTYLGTVCQDVAKILGNNGSKVRADLVKLNIYGPGGFFKSHVDSPQGDAFGSLVVFLPNAFEGGVLNVEHESESREYNFGGKDCCQCLNWVAFFNDCVHWITEVTAGYRLTLSYNLCFEDVKSDISVKADERMLETLGHLSPRSRYMYYCEHYYGNNALKHAPTPLMILKGKDAQVWLASKELGFTIELKLYIKQTNYNEFGQRIQDEFFGDPKKIENITAGQIQGLQGIDEQQRQWMAQAKTKKYGLVKVDRSIPLENLNNEIKSSKYIYAIEGYYGNDYSIEQKYCQLVLYIS